MRRIIIFICAFGFSMISCTTDLKEEGKELAELVLNSVSTSARMKSVIQTDVLPDAYASAGIGISLLSESGEPYYASASYENVRVSQISGKWQFASPVYLSSLPGVLYGYFPYNPDLDDITSILVEASLNGTDYLYAEPVTGLSKSKASADINFRHALSRITVKFLKDASYTGPGVLSGITLNGDGLSATGKLNAMTGAIDAVKSEVCLHGGGEIVPEGFTAECLVVPVPGEEDGLPLEISCVIDGTQFNLPVVDRVRISGGLQSSIVVNLEPEGLSLIDLWTEPWRSGDEICSTLDGMRKVNIQFESEEISKDVLFHGYPQGTNFVIEAYSISGKTLECSVPEECECMPTQDWDSRIYKFMISGIKKDITAVISYPHDDEILEEVGKIKVRNTAFFKKVFMDAGYMFDPGVSTTITKQVPPALTELLLTDDPDGSTWKYMEAVLYDTNNGDNDTLFIKEYFDGYSSDTEKIDLNGPLLYPDGDPRFSVYFCMGGNADNAYRHKACIGEENLWQLRAFFDRGGSYVASGGAGTVFLSGRYDGEPNSGYMSLHDANTCRTHSTSSSSRKIVMEEQSPLLKYDGVVNTVSANHYYGVYLDESDMPAGTEVLARYGQFSVNGYDNTGKAAVWAYKPSETAGRLVLCGSRPERNTSDQNVKDFFKSEILYAMEGNGLAKVKGVLHNGETRKMDLKEGDPAYCALGDGQCHHFVFNLKQDAPKLVINLDWETDARLDVYLKRGSYAFPESEPEYSLLSSTSETAESSSVLELKDVPAGLWFLTVRCASKPEVKRKSKLGTKNTYWSFYYAYSGTSGEIATLGGIPYAISAMWTY